MNTALRYGLILGLVSVVSSTVSYIAGVEFATSMWAGIVMMLVLLGGAVFFSFRIKKETPGLISYSQAFVKVFVMLICAWVISNVYGYALTNFVDTSYPEQLLKSTEHRMESRLKHAGMTDDQIDEAVEKARPDIEAGLRYEPITVAKGLIYFGIFAAILAAIISIFVRRKPDDSPFLEDKISDMKKNSN